MKSKGFSLVELMLVLALVGILAAMSVPNLQPGVARDKVAALKDEIFTSLSYAKNEAALRGVNVGVSPASGGSTGNEFANGWTVWADSNRNDTQDSGETLRSVSTLSSGIKMSGAAVVFTPEGRVAATQTFTVCTTSAGQGATVTVLASGVIANANNNVSCS